MVTGTLNCLPAPREAARCALMLLMFSPISAETKMMIIPSIKLKRLFHPQLCFLLTAANDAHLAEGG